jgi:hypothetical protein
VTRPQFSVRPVVFFRFPKLPTLLGCIGRRHMATSDLPPIQQLKLGDKRVRISDWPPRDRSGSIEPHHINAITMFRGMPWLIKAFDLVVPDSYWHGYADPETDEAIAVIECQCGETPWVGGARITECACHRFFLLVGEEVRCYRPSEEAISDLPELDDEPES